MPPECSIETLYCLKCGGVFQPASVKAAQELRPNPRHEFGMQSSPLRYFLHSSANRLRAQTYQWDGANGVGKSGFGVARSPAGKSVYVNTQMANTLMMTDGKVTGFAVTGRGYYPVID